MLHLKKYENVFDNINDITDEAFWEQVIQKFGSIRNVETHNELILDIDEDMIEFGIDYGQIYNVAFSANVGPSGGWSFDATSYPDGDVVVRSIKVNMINDPQIMAAFLAVAMPE